MATFNYIKAVWHNGPGVVTDAPNWVIAAIDQAVAEWLRSHQRSFVGVHFHPESRLTLAIFVSPTALGSDCLLEDAAGGSFVHVIATDHPECREMTPDHAQAFFEATYGTPLSDSAVRQQRNYLLLDLPSHRALATDLFADKDLVEGVFEEPAPDAANTASSSLRRGLGLVGQTHPPATSSEGSLPLSSLFRHSAQQRRGDAAAGNERPLFDKDLSYRDVLTQLTEAQGGGTLPEREAGTSDPEAQPVAPAVDNTTPAPQPLDLEPTIPWIPASRAGRSSKPEQTPIDSVHPPDRTGEQPEGTHTSAQRWRGSQRTITDELPFDRGLSYQEILAQLTTTHTSPGTPTNNETASNAESTSADVELGTESDRLAAEFSENAVIDEPAHAAIEEVSPPHAEPAFGRNAGSKSAASPRWQAWAIAAGLTAAALLAGGFVLTKFGQAPSPFPTRDQLQPRSGERRISRLQEAASLETGEISSQPSSLSEQDEPVARFERTSPVIRAASLAPEQAALPRDAEEWPLSLDAEEVRLPLEAEEVAYSINPQEAAQDAEALVGPSAAPRPLISEPLPGRIYAEEVALLLAPEPSAVPPQHEQPPVALLEESQPAESPASEGSVEHSADTRSDLLARDAATEVQAVEALRPSAPQTAPAASPTAELPDPAVAIVRPPSPLEEKSSQSPLGASTASSAATQTLAKTAPSIPLPVPPVRIEENRADASMLESLSMPPVDSIREASPPRPERAPLAGTPESASANSSTGDDEREEQSATQREVRAEHANDEATSKRKRRKLMGQMQRYR